MKSIHAGLLAATAVVSLPSLAHAAVVSSNVSIDVPASTAGVYINVVTGVTGTNPSNVSGWDINPWGSSSLRFYGNNPSGGIVVQGNAAADLAAGTVIDANSTYLRTPTSTAASFLTGGDHVFGFRFFNESTGAVNYGYGVIATTASNNGRPATITQLVYENTGLALTVGGGAGGVPEPATWAMMLVGFGAIGFASRRASSAGLIAKVA